MLITISICALIWNMQFIPVEKTTSDIGTANFVCNWGFSNGEKDNLLNVSKANDLSSFLPGDNIKNVGNTNRAFVDLASDTAWTLSIDDDAPRSIKVPGGGYNSDRQEQPLIDQKSVKDHVIYRRQIIIPREADKQVIVLEFGAVNCGAEVYIADGLEEKLVTTHAGPMMPFIADLTHLVTPGKTYTLKVKSFPAWHYGNRVPRGFFYEEAWKNPITGWASRNAAGITKYVHLVVYPEVRISDVFIRTSVSRFELACDVWVRNHSNVPRTVIIKGELDSWNGDKWKYPVLPETTVTIPSDSETKVRLIPVAWTLGPTSYWWPNKPFREDYRAKLHNLNLTLYEKRSILDRCTQRFGFVEWTEGPFYYKVNGVRINYISDGTPEPAMSEYDCYSVAPAFLPPTSPGTGCPETWRRYMRMGICANRIHQSTPTQYMMNAADEVGFMLIPETAIRCNQETWDDELIPQTVKDLAQVCRSHPSTCRYSLMNETHPDWAGPLADAIATVDDTRPLVFEDNMQNKPGVIFGRQGTHAYCMLHYQPHPKPAQMICGIGECAWANAGKTGNGVEDFAIRALDGRCQDIAYYAGWDWINYWPNFLEDMDAKHHGWKQKECWHEDRIDSIDGWKSPVMHWVQSCFHPFLVLDREFYETNGPFSKEWPKQVPNALPGDDIVRQLVMFNDVLAGDRLTVRWTAHWDSPVGTVAATGLINDIPIKPGFHVGRTISFPAPATPVKRLLFLVLESIRDGKQVFIDDQVRVVIDPTIPK